MQERKDCVIALGTAVIIRLAIGVNPPIWIERGRVVAPKPWRAVDCPGADDDLGAFGDESVVNCCRADGVTDGDWDCWVEAECFVADCVEERQRLEELGELNFWTWACGEVLADLLS